VNTRDPVSWLMIEPGWTVASKEGDELGTVHEVLGDEDDDIFDGLAVSRGLLRPQYYVPAENVAEITEGRVVLDLSADAFERLDEYEPT
jgi:uncharacterized protein YrrD